MIQIRKPDDFHLHIRQGELLPHYLGDTATTFARALIMPNTVPPVNNAERLGAYQQEIAAALTSINDFKPLYTFKIHPAIREDELLSLKKLGAIAGKYYPQGATTNSDDGVSDFTEIFPLLEKMQELDMVLCIHGEDPEAYVLDREKAFLPVLGEIRRQFPDLRIVLEHISTKDGIQAVRALGDHTAGTITVHHLMCNLNHMLGGFLNPHLFCKPLLKHPEDQQALMQAAFSGESRFFLGTDSAPHQRGQKECDCGCAGTYTAPVAIPALFQFFMEQGVIQESDVTKFQLFTAENGANFYGLPLNERSITLEKKNWTVPSEYHGVVPFLAGQTLEWSVV